MSKPTFIASLLAASAEFFKIDPAQRANRHEIDRLSPAQRAALKAWRHDFNHNAGITLQARVKFRQRGQAPVFDTAVMQ